MIVLIGESGCGKTTIEKEIVNRGYKKAVSLTSRLIRKGEVEGVDYYFKDLDHLEKLREEGKIVEWVEYVGNVYALTREECETSHIVVVEPEGLRQLQEIEGLNIEVVYLRCNEKVRADRMRTRGDKEVNIQERLKNDRTYFKGIIDISDIIINVEDKSIEYITNLVEGLLNRGIVSN